MDERVAELVLRAVELVPPGRVVSYGDLARLVGVGPRQVGAVLSGYGGGVTWWRVTNAAGDLSPDLLDQARPHWREEGIRLKPTGRGCRVADHRADLEELERHWRGAVSDLPEVAQAGPDHGRSQVSRGRW